MLTVLQNVPLGRSQVHVCVYKRGPRLFPGDGGGGVVGGWVGGSYNVPHRIFPILFSEMTHSIFQLEVHNIFLKI